MRGYRGFDKNGKGWVYGDLIHNQKVTVTGLEPRVMVGGYEVFPESVGQDTGGRDIHGDSIYEGDIVRFTRKGTVCTAIVEYRDYAYSIRGCKDIEIMGKTWKE